MGFLEEHEADINQRLATIMRPRPEARAAARWWRDAIHRPGGPHTGSPRNDGSLAVLSCAVDAAPSAIIADCFEAELAAIIEAEIQIYEKRHSTLDFDYAWQWFVSIHVDYHPTQILCMAAERAGMIEGEYDSFVFSFVFPCKTVMHIDRGRITVSAGYGARDRVVWASEEGLAYWVSDAMAKCRDELLDLADGNAARGPVVRSIADWIESGRPPVSGHLPKEHRPYEPPASEGTFGEGFDAGVAFVAWGRVA